ncbi:MAG: AI-2E family transporter [Elusimicrobia bacterium]|nr:AI-2E family transporter [Elusimicrobiota bacterium]
MPRPRRFPWFFFLAMAATLGAAFYALYHVLIPFLLGCAIAYIANPMVSYFEVRGLRREVTVIGLYTAIIVAAVMLAGTGFDIAMAELAELQADLPYYVEKLKGLRQALHARISQPLPVLGRTVQWDVHWDAKLSAASLLERVQDLPSYLLGVVPILSLLLLVPFISFFLMVDGPRSIGRMIQSCPSRYVEQVLHLISEIDTSLGNYLRGLIVIAAAITVTSFIGLLALGVDQALAIALLSGLSSFVPYLGAIVGALVGGLMAAFQFGTAAAGLKVVALFIGIRLADEFLLQPYIARHSVHLHPLVFLFTFMVGGEMFGFIGLLFAVPAACVIKALTGVLWAWYSSEARLQVPDSFDASVVPYT